MGLQKKSFFTITTTTDCDTHKKGNSIPDEEWTFLFV
jgi:hypothetical protein